MIAANIKQTADALKVSPECAVYLMSVASLMRLGTYKTRLEFEVSTFCNLTLPQESPSKATEVVL